MKKTIIVLLAITILCAITLYVPFSIWPFGRPMLMAIEKRTESKIAFRTLKVFLLRSLEANDVEAVSKEGFGARAGKACIKYDIRSLVTGRLHLVANFEEVSFYKSGTIMTSISDMLCIKPIGNMVFDTLNVDLFIGREDTITHNLILENSQIRIKTKAVIDREDNVSCLIHISVSDALTKDIPDQVRETFFDDEGGGWLGIDIGIMGNYSKPVLRILTKRFRMNIAVPKKRRIAS